VANDTRESEADEWPMMRERVRQRKGQSYRDIEIEIKIDMKILTIILF